MTDIPIICSYWILDAQFDICMDADATEEVKNLRMDATRSLPGYLYCYAKLGFLDEVIVMVCRKKLEFIKQANTRAEIREIMTPPRPRWYAGKVICDSPYHIDAEELLIWAYVSPSNKLLPEAQERYIRLFESVFGCSVDDYLKKGRT